jgi:hypothetical protein
MYWDEQKDIRMDDKEDEHLDESMFMIYMVLNNETFMQQIINVLVKVKLDEKHSVISGSTRIIVSNPKTQMGTTTHQGA